MYGSRGDPTNMYCDVTSLVGELRCIQGNSGDTDMTASGGSSKEQHAEMRSLLLQMQSL
jgi:hypothetical protein